MLKKFRSLLLVMAVILVVVSSFTFAATKPIKIVYGHIFSIEHDYVKGDNYFKELVEKNSKRKILVELYPASQLGSIAEQSLAIMSGSQQMLCNGAGVFNQNLPKLTTLELPYIFRNQEHYIKVADKLKSIVDQKELAAKLHLRILGARLSPPRHVSSKTPINKIEDMKGLKLRIPEMRSWSAFFKACGAIPVAIPIGDVYTALATGTVDGVEQPLDAYYNSKYYEQQKYIAFTGHISTHNIMFINSNFWDGLTKAQQKIIQDAVDKSDAMVNKIVLEKQNDYKKMLEEKGIKFTTPELTPFVEKAKPVLKEFGDAELVKRIQAVK
jgi:tripartite ATP-independent transporter DctP family solute receptor